MRVKQMMMIISIRTKVLLQFVGNYHGLKAVVIGSYEMWALALIFSFNLYI